MRWLITTHAVERLMGRADRELSPRQAHALLEEALPRAQRQEDATLTGQERWLIPGKTPVIVIAKKDAALKCRVAVSVLRVDETPETNLEDPTDEILHAYQRQLGTMGAVDVTPFVSPTSERRSTGALYNRINELEAATARAQTTIARQAEEQALAEAERRYYESEKAADRLKRAEAGKRVADTEALKLMSRVRDLERAIAHSPTAPLALPEEASGKLRRALDHAAHETEDKEKFRGCLRIAVRYLRQHGLTDALHAIADVDAYLTTEAFTDPERFTPVERRQAARLARAEHEHEEAEEALA